MGVCEERTSERAAEQSPQLEAVARKRLVKTKHARKSLVVAMVICELWRLAVALFLLVLTSRDCISDQ
jgi:hypothetical protein